MSKHIPSIAAACLGWALFVIAIGWPLAALIATCVAADSAPQYGSIFGARQGELLGRTLFICASGTALAVALAIAPSLAIGGAVTRGGRTFWYALLLAALLCPPTVYAFGWLRLLPNGTNPTLACIVVWSLWMWPVPAAIIGSVWSRFGRAQYELALIDTTPFSATVHIIIPSMVRVLLLAALVVFLHLLNGYGVPHAFGLQVYATELLATAQSARSAIDAVVPALAPTAVSIVAVAGVLFCWRKGQSGSDDLPLIPSWHTGAIVITMFLLCVGCLLPLARLATDLRSLDPFWETIRVYHADISWSLLVALLSGIVSTIMGATLGAMRLGRTVAIPVAIVVGMMPGAVIGQAMISAYNRPGLFWVYDHAPVLVIAYTARFAWIGILAGAYIARSSPRELVDSACVDGASATQIWWRVTLPMRWPMLAGVCLIVTALALGDVSASSMVRVPAFTPMAHLIIEKFHRFEDEVLISLCLILVTAALAAAALIVVLMRRAPIEFSK